MYYCIKNMSRHITHTYITRSIQPNCHCQFLSQITGLKNVVSKVAEGEVLLIYRQDLSRGTIKQLSLHNYQFMKVSNKLYFYDIQINCQLYFSSQKIHVNLVVICIQMIFLIDTSLTIINEENCIPSNLDMSKCPFLS